MSQVTGWPRSIGGRRAASPSSRPNDREALRAVLGRFATGVTIVAVGTDRPQGMTANAFTSVSLNPPLVLVCVNRRATIHQAVLDEGSFTVSVLSAHQEHVARYFADHSRPRGSDEFGAVSWSSAPDTGGPVLHGALAWMDCALTEAFDGGDHSIFLGSVLAIGREPAGDALLFFGGDFHHLESS